jgi:hypothetical protein
MAAPIGVITLQRRAVRPFTEKQIELFETFADQAGDRHQTVRLFDEVQARTKELSESLEQQTATSEVLGVILSSPGELEPVFNKMLENATRVCNAKFDRYCFRSGVYFGPSHSTTYRPRLLNCVAKRRRERATECDAPASSRVRRCTQRPGWSAYRRGP